MSLSDYPAPIHRSNAVTLEIKYGTSAALPHNGQVCCGVFQWWCASSVLIGVVAQGMMLGYTACLLPGLQALGSPIQLDIGRATWLASIIGPAVLVGIVAACFAMDRLGRRKANLLSTVPGIIGWAMIHLAQSYLVIFIGRILTAVTTGALCTVGTFMIGEYTSPQLRGMFLNLKSTSIYFGSAITHILSYFIHWRTIAIIALIPQVVGFVITLTCPESPSWLATRKQYDKCEKEFFWLRGVTEKSVREVNELIESQKQRFSQPKILLKEKIKNFFVKFTMKDFFKPLLINIVAVLVIESSGRHYFPAYALQIMKDVIDSKIPVHYYTLCIDIVVIVSTLVSAVLIRMLNMRTLLFVSGIGSLVVLVLMCTFLYLTLIGVVSNYPWIITSLFIVFFAFGNLGCCPVSLALQGELFPLAHREVGFSLLGVFVSLALMGFVKVTPYLLVSLGVYGTFLVFGAILATALLILYFILPETKDKTLQEIENYFKYGKYTVNNDESDNVYSKMLIKGIKKPTSYINSFEGGDIQIVTERG